MAKRTKAGRDANRTGPRPLGFADLVTAYGEGQMPPGYEDAKLYEVAFLSGPSAFFFCKGAPRVEELTLAEDGIVPKWFRLDWPLYIRFRLDQVTTISLMLPIDAKRRLKV